MPGEWIMISRRKFLAVSCVAPALPLVAAHTAQALETQGLSPGLKDQYAARCATTPHEGHLAAAFDSLAKAGIKVPLAQPQACPICGCQIAIDAKP